MGRGCGVPVSALTGYLISMQNVTSLLTKKDRSNHDEASWTFPGGVSGFAAWWISLASVFLLYGANTLFFFLYTWPLFLALLPVSVLIGITINVVLQGYLIRTVPVTLFLVGCLFWVLFFQLSGW